MESKVERARLSARKGAAWVAVAGALSCTLAWAAEVRAEALPIPLPVPPSMPAPVPLPAPAPADRCQIFLSDAALDYGNRSRYEVGATRAQPHAALGEKDTTLSVVCSRPTRFAVFFRGAPAASGSGFRLGDGLNATIELSKVQADGRDVLLGLVDTPAAAPARPAPAVRLTPQYGAAVAPSQRVSRLNAQVKVDATLDMLPGALADRAIDGSGDFEIVVLD